MTETKQKQIAKEWVDFAKNSFYYDGYSNHEDCEFHEYAPINDSQWILFGKLMTYITEDWTDPIPGGTEERMWYRAFAKMITVGPEGTKKMISEVIDGTAHGLSVVWHMLSFVGYSKIIFETCSVK